MSGDIDPRDCDSRGRDDGVHDRQEDWLAIGRGPSSGASSDASLDATRERDEDSVSIN